MRQDNRQGNRDLITEGRVLSYHSRYNACHNCKHGSTECDHGIYRIANEDATDKVGRDGNENCRDRPKCYSRKYYGQIFKAEAQNLTD